MVHTMLSVMSSLLSPEEVTHCLDNIFVNFAPTYFINFQVCENDQDFHTRPLPDLAIPAEDVTTFCCLPAGD